MNCIGKLQTQGDSLDKVVRWVDCELELSECFSNSVSEPSSGSSRASFCSANEDFQPYDDSESFPNEHEAAEYSRQIAQEEEEEDMLFSRFTEQTAVKDWHDFFTVFAPFPVLTDASILKIKRIYCITVHASIVGVGFVNSQDSLC